MNPRTSPSTDGSPVTVHATRTLADQVSARLRESPYSATRAIQSRVQAGIVTLTGTVPSFHLKQVAQTLVGDLDGVERVDNRIEVVEEHEETARHDMRDAP